MNWIEVSVAADEEAVEAVAERMRSFGQGVSIDVPFVQPSVYDDAEWDPGRKAVVKTYLPDDGSAEMACRQIEESLWHLGRLREVGPVTTRRIAEEDWANAWKPFFPVLHVGERMVVVPAWRRHRRRDDDIVIRLDPGLAFGTGTHPTTRLCLTALEPLVKAGARVLDVGTGSGILAIAAAQLGAGRVFGLDIDPLAVAAARANVKLNRLSRKIVVREGSPDDSAAIGAELAFDLVLCNVTARVNARLAGPLAEVLAPTGAIVISGILAQDFSTVVTAFERAGLAVRQRYEEEDWTAAVLERAR